jgi:Bacterial TSP3 repeat
MKSSFATLLLLASLPSGKGATTIDPVNKYAYGANLGWINASTDGANGAVIGEYVCSGYLYSPNVGWINLGGGSPANGIRYQNNSATDFGVNHDGRGHLSGYAWGANIGWIQFTDTTATGPLPEADVPRLDLKTGKLGGLAYSANGGWISLSNALAYVQTDTIQSGADTDGDGIADAWELSYTNTLGAFNAGTDTDGDGVSDLAEYLADTSPLDPHEFLRIISYSVLLGSGNETNTLAWTSKETRCYQLETRTTFNAGTPWVDATAILAPDSGSSTARLLILPGAPPAQRYFRVKAVKPLSP